MDRANYKNGMGRYPLSTEGLDFIQRQIELIYSVAELHGRNYILKDSTDYTEGVIVVDGELMPLVGSPQAYIEVVETGETLEADGLTYERARVSRRAVYSGVKTDSAREVSEFVQMTTIEEMKPHLMPKGAIVMWSGAITAIPKGWALCDGTKGTPNLSGRFIVGAGKSSDGDTKYQLNTTGGEEKVLLKANECALPKHSHTYEKTTLNKTSNIDKEVNSKGYREIGSETLTTSECTKEAATDPHENRPPYYVLAYIMKIV